MLGAKRVEAPGSSTRGCQVEEQKTEEHSHLTVIQDGPEPSRSVSLEVRHCHLTRQKKSHRAGKESNQEEEAAEGLQHTGKTHEGQEGSTVARLTRRPGT